MTECTGSERDNTGSIDLHGDADDDVFTSTPKDECPICLVRLPHENGDTVYLSCCGKTVCIGCPHANKTMLQEEMAKLETSVNAAAADDGQQATPMLAAHPIVKCLTKDSYPCPFCRRETDEEIVSVLKKRMDLQDPQAYFNMAGYAREGLHGVRIPPRASRRAWIGRGLFRFVSVLSAGTLWG